jgi:predicted CoA-substrate-specific enzyme activase
MITAGIDMGLKYIKAVILKDGKVAGRGYGHSGGAERAANAEAAYNAALKDAGVAPGDVSKVVATGIGKYDVPFAADCWTESLTAAKAARFLCPEATTVVDIGADETLVSTLKEDGGVDEFTINQKCAAGLGLFLNYMAERLELTMDEMSAAAPATTNYRVSDGCVPFAELDALSLLNHDAAPREIAAAVTLSTAARAASTINDITVPARKCVVLCGGLTKNKAFVKALESLTDITFQIPADAEYAGAIGAALIAAA